MPAFVDADVRWFPAQMRFYPPQGDVTFHDNRVICPHCSSPIESNCDLIQHSLIDDPQVFTIFLCHKCQHSMVYSYLLSDVPANSSIDELMKMFNKINARRRRKHHA